MFSLSDIQTGRAAISYQSREFSPDVGHIFESEGTGEGGGEAVQPRFYAFISHRDSGGPFRLPTGIFAGRARLLWRECFAGSGGCGSRSEDLLSAYEKASTTSGVLSRHQSSGNKVDTQGQRALTLLVE